MPSPQMCIWSPYDLDLWPLTLKIYLAMPTHNKMNRRYVPKGHWNSSTKYRNIASREIDASSRAAVSRWLIPQQEKCTWPRYDLDLWLLTLETFLAMAGVYQWYTKFHRYPFIHPVKIYRITRKVLTGWRTMHGLTDDPTTEAYRHLLLAAEATKRGR